jgi:hypothetical protein
MTPGQFIQLVLQILGLGLITFLAVSVSVVWIPDSPADLGVPPDWQD